MIEMFRASIRIQRYHEPEFCCWTVWSSSNDTYLARKTTRNVGLQKRFYYNAPFLEEKISNTSRVECKLHVHWWFLIAILSDARKDTYWKTYYLYPEKKSRGLFATHIHQKMYFYLTYWYLNFTIQNNKMVTTSCFYI